MISLQFDGTIFATLESARKSFDNSCMLRSPLLGIQNVANVRELFHRGLVPRSPGNGSPSLPIERLCIKRRCDRAQRAKEITQNEIRKEAATLSPVLETRRR